MNKLTILFRTDASVAIGSGHVMRCLTIAKGLRKQGHQVHFWMESLPGNLIDLVQEEGFVVTHQAQAVDILIVDHYQLGLEWETSMRPLAKKIVVIDDLANRLHDCDLLLDQNVVGNYEHRYDGLVPTYCRKLLGPTYLIMRDEFIEARMRSNVRAGQVNRLLLFMGGSDPTGETLKVLHAIEQLKESDQLWQLKHGNLCIDHIDVVVGTSNAHCREIEQKCKELELHYHCQINYLAELMRLADFAIGAGGSAMWERCYVGLPSSSTVVAHNQKPTTEKAAELGAIIDLGWHEEISSGSYLHLLRNLPSLGAELVAMSEQGYKITESQGQPNAWLQEMVGLLS